MENKYETNWSDLDLTDDYQRNLPILDSYSIDVLLLEINCNIKNINKESITAQFMESLNQNINSAKEIFFDNLDNIEKISLKNRKNG